MEADNYCINFSAISLAVSCQCTLMNQLELIEFSSMNIDIHDHYWAEGVLFKIINAVPFAGIQLSKQAFDALSDFTSVPTCK